jgi:co-chaperonin GroES (HSP10)
MGWEEGIPTGEGAVDKGEVNQIISRQRKEKADPFFVQSVDNKVMIGGKIKLSFKLGDSIIVYEDKFKSSYDCSTCDGVGDIVTLCTKCDGSGIDATVSPAIECGKCSGIGKITKECRACNGKGALLEIPDAAKARPTSGTVVAIGPEVCTYLFALFGYKFFRKESYKIGDRVAYSGYTGHLIPFKGNTRLRIMRQNEPFCLVEDVPGASDRGEKIEFVDKDTAYDLS